MKTVFEELIVAAKTVPAFKPQLPGEPEKDFLERLAVIIGKEVSDLVWNNIPKEAQEWYQAASGALNQGEAIPPCPGYQQVIPEVEKVVAEAIAQPIQPPVTAPQPVQPPPIAKPTASAVQEIVSTQATPVAAPVSGVVSRRYVRNYQGKTGIMHRLRELILKNPTITPEGLMQLAAAEGWTNISLNTAYICCYEVRNVVKAIHSVVVTVKELDEFK